MNNRYLHEREVGGPYVCQYLVCGLSFTQYEEWRVHEHREKAVMRAVFEVHESIVDGQQWIVWCREHQWQGDRVPLDRLVDSIKWHILDKHKPEV